jgi:hypothetical protein
MIEGKFVPWCGGLDRVEFTARCRALRTVCIVQLGGPHKLSVLLRAAETEPGALKLAEEEFGKLPPLSRRHILNVYLQTAAPLDDDGPKLSTGRR